MSQISVPEISHGCWLIQSLLLISKYRTAATDLCASNGEKVFGKTLRGCSSHSSLLECFGMCSIVRNIIVCVHSALSSVSFEFVGCLSSWLLGPYLKGPMLLLTINRKLYMASLMTSLLLTLSDLERSKSRSLRFSVAEYLYGIDIFASSNITTIWMSQ